MPSLLQVKPATRYQKPRYPSHAEPNPLDHPQALPYPFSQRLLDWALAAGLLGIGACQFDRGPVVISNTFTFDKTGLPYHSPTFGTGQPDHLEAKEMREVALRICREEGLTVREDILWEKKRDYWGDLDFPISLYDDKHRIGISILSYDNLHHSAIEGFGRYWGLDNTYETWESAWSTFSRGSSEDIRYWLNIEQRATWTADEKHLYDLFLKAAFTDIPDSEKWLFYKMYLRYRHDGINQQVLLNERAVARAIQNKSEVALKLELGRNDARRKLLEIRPEKNWDAKVLQQYTDSYLESESKVLRSLDFIIALLNGYVYYSKPEQEQLRLAVDLFFHSYRPQWQEEVIGLVADYDRTRFDIDEVQQLDELANDKEIFVAPVSFNDKRFLYRHTDKDVEEALQSLPQDVDSTYIAKLKSESKSAAIQRLEENLRMYIRWSKYQGQY
jgi:hypothetical protein